MYRALGSRIDDLPNFAPMVPNDNDVNDVLPEAFQPFLAAEEDGVDLDFNFHNNVLVEDESLADHAHDGNDLFLRSFQNDRDYPQVGYVRWTSGSGDRHQTHHHYHHHHYGALTQGDPHQQQACLTMPPDAKDVPLPSFARRFRTRTSSGNATTVTTITTTSSVRTQESDHLDQDSEDKEDLVLKQQRLRDLSDRKCDELQLFLSEVASALLAIRERASLTSSLGRNLSERSKAWLRLHNFRLSMVLRFFSLDFSVQSKGGRATVTYLREELNQSYCFMPRRRRTPTTANTPLNDPASSPVNSHCYF